MVREVLEMHRHHMRICLVWATVCVLEGFAVTTVAIRALLTRARCISIVQTTQPDHLNFPIRFSYRSDP
jgi:hypothetical protein